jgi:hypothetical protein
MALRRRWWKLPYQLPPKLLVLATITGCLNGPLQAGPTERVVTDRHTGLAIYGFDPIAYFTDAKPVAGAPEYELQLADTIWRFRSNGNRDVFANNPEVYLPRYGGYDPVSVARGVAVAGNPSLWLVSGERLYFFYTSKAQQDFAANPQEITEAADEHWPDVMKDLVE